MGEPLEPDEFLVSFPLWLLVHPRSMTYRTRTGQLAWKAHGAQNPRNYLDRQKQCVFWLIRPSPFLQLTYGSFQEIRAQARLAESRCLE
jgi:hypothetical protein